MRPKCSIDWCNQPIVAIGLCSTHYARKRKKGDPLCGETRETANRRTRWTKDELNILTNFLSDKKGDFYSLDEIAYVIGRTRASVAYKVSSLGLGDFKRKKPGRYRDKNGHVAKPPKFKNKEELRQHKSETMKARLKEKGHPRGFLGGKHSKESLAIMEEKRSEYLKNATTEDHRKRTDKGIKTKIERYGTAAPIFKNGKDGPYSRARGGKREDLGDMYFRSRWEANYARYLNFLLSKKEIKKWEYEPDTFWFDKIKRGTRSYTPDFKVTENSGYVVYHEVKGWMDDKSKTKLSRMGKYYPSVNIIIIGEKEYKSIAKFSKLVLGWE